MKAWLAVVAGAVLTMGMAAAHAGDVAAGQARYAACMGCHGPTGQGMGPSPGVAGKDVAYLVEVMQRYRAGETVGPMSMMMIPAAMGLSDADIENLAAYMATMQ